MTLDVCRGMRRWHRATAALADEELRLGNRVERAGSVQTFLDLVNNERVAHADDQHEHQEKDAAPRPALPQERCGNENENGNEPRVAGELRHEGIEHGIAQLQIDEAEER